LAQVCVSAAAHSATLSEPIALCTRVAMALATSVAIGAAAISGLAVGVARNGKARAAAAQGYWADVDEEEVPQVPRRQPPSSRQPRPVAAQPQEEEGDLGWQGFSMEEARTHADKSQQEKMSRTPGEVLAELQRGNARFWMNAANRPETSAFERRGLISKQFPSVAILGCSDSRVPTEIVFDQGLGDIFVVRVAGNCLDTATLASLQFAVHHLKVKVLAVLGHELCGAVKAAMLPQDKIEQEPSELEQALKGIKVGLDENTLQLISDARAQDREAVCTNVRRQVERLSVDKGIMTKVREQELMIVGAFYEISSGIVDFFHEVSGPGVETPISPQKSNPLDQHVPFTRTPSLGVQSRFEPEVEQARTHVATNPQSAAIGGTMAEKQAVAETLDSSSAIQPVVSTEQVPTDWSPTVARTDAPPPRLATVASTQVLPVRTVAPPPKLDSRSLRTGSSSSLSALSPQNRLQSPLSPSSPPIRTISNGLGSPSGQVSTIVQKLNGLNA